MADRELLELAAKAAGYTIADWRETYHGLRPALYDTHAPGRWIWQPLDDDGDALRLAAHLRLKVAPGRHKGDGCSVESQRDGVAGCVAFRDDPAEQMRRAIVIVAAEIGRSL